MKKIFDYKNEPRIRASFLEALACVVFRRARKDAQMLGHLTPLYVTSEPIFLAIRSDVGSGSWIRLLC